MVGLVLYTANMHGSRGSDATSKSYVSRTSDGGRTWLPVLQTSDLLTTVDFGDPAHGYAVGRSGSYPAYRSVVYTTGDGGQTWSPPKVPDVRGRAASLRCFGASSCLLLTAQDYADSCLGGVCLARASSALYRTVDGFSTVTQSAIEFLGDGLGEQLTSIAIASPGRAIAVGTSGSVWTSDAAGATLTLRSGHVFGQSYGQARVVLRPATAHTAFALGPNDDQFDNTLARTRDGGRTWTALSPPEPANAASQLLSRLVDQVMTVEPYRSARTVFWIVDNGSSHAGKTSIKRISDAHPNARLIHLPVHASWLNQAELLFSIVQRKALTPNDFATLPQLARHLMDFGQHYRNIARPFDWTFTRADLDRILDKIAQRDTSPLALAA